MQISEKVPFEPARKKPNFFLAVAFSSHVFFYVSKILSVAVKISGASAGKVLVHLPSLPDMSCRSVCTVRRLPADSPWLGCLGRLWLGKHAKC